MISEWLWADYLLYEHFKNKFLKKREAFGLQNLENDKRILKEAIDRVEDRCIKGKVENNVLPKKDRIFGHNVMGYEVKMSSGKDCPYYTMGESHFVDIVRSIQRNKSNEKLKSADLREKQKELNR